MRSPQNVLESLTAKATNTNYHYQRLYRNLYNPEFYLLAYQRIQAKQGNMTTGSDGKTIDGMGMKRIVVQVVNRFGYRRVLVATTLGLSLVTLLFMTTALLGWYYVLPFVLFLQGMVNSTRFSSMNTLTLKDLPDNLASSGNSLLSMIMQLSMSIGVTIAGLLLGLFGSQHVSVDSGTTQTVFMYTWLSMALIIALPAFIFARVPNDTHQNVAISRRKRSAQ